MSPLCLSSVEQKIFRELMKLRYNMLYLMVESEGTDDSHDLLRPMLRYGDQKEPLARFLAPIMAKRNFMG